MTWYVQESDAKESKMKSHEMCITSENLFVK